MLCNELIRGPSKNGSARAWFGVAYKAALSILRVFKIDPHAACAAPSDDENGERTV